MPLLLLITTLHFDCSRRKNLGVFIKPQKNNYDNDLGSIYPVILIEYINLALVLKNIKNLK